GAAVDEKASCRRLDQHAGLESPTAAKRIAAAEKDDPHAAEACHARARARKHRRRGRRTYGQGMPALTQASRASTNFSCESGGLVRPPPGVQAQRTSGSVFMCSMTSLPVLRPPLRAGSFICSQI